MKFGVKFILYEITSHSYILIPYPQHDKYRHFLFGGDTRVIHFTVRKYLM